MTAVQVPKWPGALQISHELLHVPLQQTPLVQKPLAHSAAVEHAIPTPAFETHMPAEQYFVDGHAFPSVTHGPLHFSRLASQPRPSQEMTLGLGKRPVPSHASGSVAMVPSQIPLPVPKPATEPTGYWHELRWAPSQTPEQSEPSVTH